MLFWDYDTQWGGDRSRVNGPQQWGNRERDNTDHLLDLLARFDVPSCFAVVGAAALPGEDVYHLPEQIRRIHAAGHEIASHSHRHEWLPGLGPEALRETLGASRDALEQCIGAPVSCFVPPFNQPYDFLRVLSISLAERREAGRDRTDLRRLCEALNECGYRTARVFYMSLPRRLMRGLFGRRMEGPSQRSRIAGVSCVRLNTPCGFGEQTRNMLERCARDGGLTVAYAHPHSLSSPGLQDRAHLIPFLQRVCELRRERRLEVVLPADLLDGAIR
jgi:polysaccharide deacetylase